MHCVEEVSGDTWVALRKESVDRNIELLPWGGWGARSLSARRAWIEMPDSTHRREPFPVALRKESVDRNSGALRTTENQNGRSPQGERG